MPNIASNPVSSERDEIPGLGTRPVPVRYVLSTGRTGTTYLREWIRRHRSHLGIDFEPPPSRWAYLLWNAQRAGLPLMDLAARLMDGRQRRVDGSVAGVTAWVEFHNYLSPMVCEMLREQRPDIVHMLRHPYTWIQSQGNFKANSWRRHAVDFTPFTEIVHPEIRHSYRRLSRELQLAWTWRYVNECIFALQPGAGAYCQVKYEDFFSSSSDTRRATLASMLEVLDPATATVSEVDASSRLNEGRSGRIATWETWPAELRREVDGVCADLVERVGYPREPT